MAHKKKIQTVKTVNKETKEVSTEKKVVDKKEKKVVKEVPKYPADTLVQRDWEQFKELAVLSNNVAGIKKGIADKKLAEKKLSELVKKIDKGEIKPPFIEKVLQNLYISHTDMKNVSKKLKETSKMIEKGRLIEEGQLAHRYEEYVGALIRFRNHLTKIIGKEEIKNIAAHREPSVRNDEKIIFEKNFEDFVQKETKKAK